MTPIGATVLAGCVPALRATAVDPSARCGQNRCVGLDVYVGTLTRYYAGAWETIIQRTARETATPLRVMRQNHPPNAITDPIVIENTVNMWREVLNAGLQPNLNAPLAWTEGMAPPYFTDKPAWDCYGALLVWAAHEKHPEMPLPADTPDDWRTDAAVQRSQSEGFVSRYMGSSCTAPSFGFRVISASRSRRTISQASPSRSAP